MVRFISNCVANQNDNDIIITILSVINSEMNWYVLSEQQSFSNRIQVMKHQSSSEPASPKSVSFFICFKSN